MNNFQRASIVTFICVMLTIGVFNLVDYIQRNNLGGMDNHCMKLARAAMKEPT